MKNICAVFFHGNKKGYETNIYILYIFLQYFVEQLRSPDHEILLKEEV